MIKKETLLRVMRWQYNSGDTGLSSECMAANLCGLPCRRIYAPTDPADFNRCLGLLDYAPELRVILHRMRDVSAEWEALVDNWDRVEKSFIEEVGKGWAKKNKSASKTYELMKGLGL